MDTVCTVVEKITDIGKRLHEILRKKGLPEEHINLLVSTKPNKYLFFQHYYQPPTKNPKPYSMSIAPEKIVLNARLSNTASVYHNAAGLCENDLSPASMQKALWHIEQDPLEQLHEWYGQKCMPVQLIYYKDDDTYGVGSDGWHRSLYALVSGAPSIRAKVTEYRINKPLYEAFKFFYSLRQKYHILEVCPLPGDARDGQYYQDQVQLRIEYEGRAYRVNGYQNPMNRSRRYDLDNLKILERQLLRDFRLIGGFPAKWFIMRKHVGWITDFVMHVVRTNEAETAERLAQYFECGDDYYELID